MNKRTVDINSKSLTSMQKKFAEYLVGYEGYSALQVTEF